MKHLRQIIILVVFSIIGQQNIFAQFNTLGREYPITSSQKKKSYQPNSMKEKEDSSVHIVPKEVRVKNTMERPMISLPLKKIFITSPYGYRIHPVTGKYKLHNGIDLRARYEEVYSMLPGKVHKIGADKISGKYVIIVTGNYMISYCHLSEIRVENGSLVSAGDVIAISGKSGRVSGPHLHLTCKLEKRLINPTYLFEMFDQIYRSHN